MAANPYADMMKMWSDYKTPQMPSVDVTQLMAIGRKNAEAFTAAGQTIAESAQAISRRQAELSRAHVEKCLKTAKDALVNGSPEINTSKHMDLCKSMFETSLNNLREVTELCTKSGFEAFDLLNKRASASIQEISSQATKTAKKAAA